MPERGGLLKEASYLGVCFRAYFIPSSSFVVPCPSPGKHPHLYEKALQCLDVAYAARHYFKGGTIFAIRNVIGGAGNNPLHSCTTMRRRRK